MGNKRRKGEGAYRGRVESGFTYDRPFSAQGLSAWAASPPFQSRGKTGGGEIRQREFSCRKCEVRLSSPLQALEKTGRNFLVVRRRTSVCSTGDNYKQTLGRERGREEGAGRPALIASGSVVYLPSPV